MSANTFLSHNFTFSPTLRAHMQMMWLKYTYMGVIRLDDMWGMDVRVESLCL
ncbi:MAG: hypothetical protein LBI58_07570 [Tannerellaceae bacterium]|nr:hypothetical protein [Tannerellaceae bacterium]